MRRKVLIFVLGFIGVLFMIVGGVVLQIVRYSFIDDVQQADAIVVLGAAQYAGRPSPVFAARLDHAYELYKAGYATTIITTGGSQSGEKFSEGWVGKNYLIKKGVPADNILIDSDSDTTLQNLARADDIAKSNSLTSFILVSDPFHMFRSKLIAERIGMHAVTSPTLTSPISKNFWLTMSYVGRETGLCLLQIFFDA